MGSPRKDRHIFGYEKVNSDPLCGNDLRLLQSSKKKHLSWEKQLANFVCLGQTTFLGLYPLSKWPWKVTCPVGKNYLFRRTRRYFFRVLIFRARVLYKLNFCLIARMCRKHSHENDFQCNVRQTLNRRICVHTLNLYFSGRYKQCMFTG